MMDYRILLCVVYMGVCNLCLRNRRQQADVKGGEDDALEDGGAAVGGGTIERVRDADAAAPARPDRGITRSVRVHIRGLNKQRV